MILKQEFKIFLDNVLYKNILKLTNLKTKLVAFLGILLRMKGAPI